MMIRIKKKQREPRKKHRDFSSASKACVAVVFVIIFVYCLARVPFSYTHSSSLRASSKPVSKPPFVPPFRKRSDLAKILQEEGGFYVGVELGVQRGHFADKMLLNWPDATRYVLVDAWRELESYEDVANVDNQKQQENYEATMKRMQKHKDRGVSVDVCRDITTRCVQDFQNGEFDFIYVDARHDRKGVYLDMTQWWPKLRKGGIMCGHDYVIQSEVGAQNWTVNFDGTVDHTGLVVKGAVDDFARQHRLPITVSYREHNWNTWCLRTPW